MAIVSGRELGAALCDVFGLDPSKVGKVTVVADVGDVAKVIVEYSVAEPDEAHPLVAVLRTFAGVKKFKIESAPPRRLADAATINARLDALDEANPEPARRLRAALGSDGPEIILPLKRA